MPGEILDIGTQLNKLVVFVGRPDGLSAGHQQVTMPFPSFTAAAQAVAWPQAPEVISEPASSIRLPTVLEAQP